MILDKTTVVYDSLYSLSWKIVDINQIKIIHVEQNIPVDEICIQDYS